MASAIVLTEDEALELLAFVITATRTQLDEVVEGGPLRLLTAAPTSWSSARRPTSWRGR